MAKRTASPPSSPRITKRVSAEPTEALFSDASSSAKIVSPISPWLYSWFKPSNEPPTSNAPPSLTRANPPSSSNVNLSISTPSNNHSSAFNLLRTNTASTSVSSAPSSSSSFSPPGSQDTDIFEPRNTISALARPKSVGHALPLGIGLRKTQPNGSVHRRRRHHIHHDIHKSSIKESLRQELIKLNVQKGYSLPEAYDYLGYRERIARLEASEILSPSAAFPSAFAQRRAPRRVTSGGTDKESPPYDPARFFLEQALRRAKDSLNGPRPPPPLPALEKLRLQDLSLDAAIDERIRPKKRKLPTALPSSADAAVTKMLHIRSGLVSICGREQVQGEDIQRLRPAQWLNDEVINFYGAMITERAARWKNHDHSDATFGLHDGSSSSNRVDGSTIHVNGKKGKGREQGDPLDVHYFNTFFYEKLVNPGYEKARLNKWTKRVDIFSKDVILIPINLGNSHWTCACVNVRRKRIEYYDSLGTRREAVYQRLRDYLQRESVDKKKVDFDFEDWEDYFSEATPQQENAYDCGVFVCQFMEAISRGEVAEEFAFDQRNMPYIRRRMLWEISEKRLIGWKQ